MAISLWLAAGLLCFAVVVPLIVALRRPAASGNDRFTYDLALYRDQLAEVERDRQEGMLSDGEAAGARTEIERRMLAAADAVQLRTPTGDRSSGVTALVLAVAVPGIALLLYLQVGRPGAPDEPLNGRGERQLLAADGSLDLARMADALRARLVATPSSVEGWVMLARTEGSRGRWPAAHDAFEHALAAVPPDGRIMRGQVLGAFGELLVDEANGTVTPAAKADFDAALAIDPGDVRARYFTGLAALQAGDKATAVAAWIALAKASPPDAPFQATLRAQIVAAGGVPPAASAAADPVIAPEGPASPAGQAVAALPADQQQQAIRGMVEALATRLASDPANYEGWMRLGRSWGVLGDARKASDAYARAAALRPDDMPTLRAFADALRMADPADPRLSDLDRRLATAR